MRAGRAGHEAQAGGPTAGRRPGAGGGRRRRPRWHRVAALRRHAAAPCKSPCKWRRRGPHLSLIRLKGNWARLLARPGSRRCTASRCARSGSLFSSAMQCCGVGGRAGRGRRAGRSGGCTWQRRAPGGQRACTRSPQHSAAAPSVLPPAPAAHHGGVVDGKLEIQRVQQRPLRDEHLFPQPLVQLLPQKK